MFLRGSAGFISCVGSIVGSAFGASSSSNGGNSFTGSSASSVLVISGSTSDIYNILYVLSIFFYIFIYFIYMDKMRNIHINNLIFLLINRLVFNYLVESEC